MRLIPGKTKVQIELFKGVTLGDLLVGGVDLALIVMSLYTELPCKIYIALALLVIGAGLIFRMDTEPTYMFLLHMFRHFAYRKNYRKEGFEDDAAVIAALKAIQRAKTGEEAPEEPEVQPAQTKKTKVRDITEILPFTAIEDGFIKYGNSYYGAVIEIPAVEFRFFSTHRRNNSIENGVGRVIRGVHPELGCNIVKLERPIIYDSYIANEYDKLEELKKSFEQGVLKEEEMKARVDVIYDRITELKSYCTTDKVVESFYYIVLFGETPSQLRIQVSAAMDQLTNGELKPKLLKDKELAVFIKYTNEIDFDERDIEKMAPEDYLKWAIPMSVDVHSKTVDVNHIVTHNMRVVRYPTLVSDAWLAGVFSIPATKVVVKCRPTENARAVRAIDHALQELRGQYMATSIDSKLMEIQTHIDTLSTLLSMLQGDNEMLLDTNVYITLYDIAQTRADQNRLQPPKSERFQLQGMKKSVRRSYQEAGMRLNGMDFDQMTAFIGSQISALDPLRKEGRGIPSNTIAAMYPWIFAYVADKKGFKIGVSDGVPVFVDFFRRDSERVNSNAVIVGKSGSGKSYATKSLLTNLAADDSKIFVLDPENEYTELAANLHGKFINVGNAQHGRLNPFHIITALEDDEDEGVTGSYETHLQFLEEFFRQILPDCEKDAMEYLNSLVDRMYYEHGITPDTDLSKLKPSDYPVFDDLYDEILKEFQQTDNEYIRRMLRSLINYIAKFSTGGRNSNIWNGPSTVTTEENFTVFNFQSLLANRNGAIANAQMLLVLKYLDNEIIKNRDYNEKYGRNRKIVVAIDEAHVFIDNKYPIALDFMFQLAKRIRKYNGMQIVITQNIKDFMGNEDIARKSTAIINACQYSFIFSLSPNDMGDLCELYSKAGGINEIEQEQIIGAARGQAFAIMSPTSRSSFGVVVPPDIISMFSEDKYESGYFIGKEGYQNWEDFVGESREVRNKAMLDRMHEDEMHESNVALRIANREQVRFIEVSEEELAEEQVDDMSIPVEIPISNSISNDSLDGIQESAQSSMPEDTADKAEQAPDFNPDTAQHTAYGQPVTYVQPVAYGQPVTMNIPEDVTQLLEKLTGAVENIGRLSYESVMQSVTAMMDRQREELLAQLSPRFTPMPEAEPQRPDTATAVPYTATEENTAESYSEEEDEGSGTMLGALLGGFDTFEEETAGTAEPAFQSGSLLDALAGAVASFEVISRIDMMESYCENRAVITLEELAEHIVAHNLK